MNFDRVTINGKGYAVEARCRTEATARRLAREMGCKITRHGGRYLVLRPTGPMGLPEGKPREKTEIPFF